MKISFVYGTRLNDVFVVTEDNKLYKFPLRLINRNISGFIQKIKDAGEIDISKWIDTSL